MANDHGLLDLILEIICHTKTIGILLKSECVRTICVFLDNRMWQVKIVRAGALWPLLEMALDPLIPLIVVDIAVAGVMCCAVSSAVLDSLVEDNVSERLFYLAQNVHEMHQNGKFAYSKVLISLISCLSTYHTVLPRNSSFTKNCLRPFW